MMGRGVLSLDMESFLPVHNQELLSFSSACRPVFVYISKKFHKDILNGFKSGHDFVTETATYKAQGGITQTNIQELRFLCSACRPMLVIFL